MDLIVEELGQAFLAIAVGTPVIALFLWVLECATAF